ncbi:hypothetical protein ACIP29_27355 [Streptomyces coelicoflavus]|uniref:hypothetical protein n=1 Tax=Streptomyces coelicoflavus TaxID=285562 RepID=UPI0037FBCABD
MRHRKLVAALALVGAGALGVTAFAVTGDGGASSRPTATSTAHTEEPPTVSTPTQDHDAAVSQSRRALQTADLTLPDGWTPVRIRSERHDDRVVSVVRYEQGAPRDLGGEHITTVVGADDTLLGYTRMTVDASRGPKATDKDAARDAAFAWLDGFAARHAKGLDVQWVNDHDEEVRDPAGSAHTITGLKVKTHHDNGLYTWVIVDEDGQVITYERDIRWDGGAGRRGTEMWLHDKWIAAREGSGPQPPSPYAVANG